LASEQLSQLSEQLNLFTTKLEEFAQRHRDEIRRNPQFRRHFQDMCASVGVDPLACRRARTHMLLLTSMYSIEGLLVV
jgi:ESCRT-II complex subunit VPS22